MNIFLCIVIKFPNLKLCWHSSHWKIFSDRYRCCNRTWRAKKKHWEYSNSFHLIYLSYSVIISKFKGKSRKARRYSRHCDFCVFFYLFYFLLFFTCHFTNIYKFCLEQDLCTVLTYILDRFKADIADCGHPFMYRVLVLLQTLEMLDES